ncbi:MYND finger [Fusarium albosuccineum]|uniref:MYND finger n=1 Tax=Fusarium albosuccineum TaxID=1237068 RepID=A0A8H4L8C1_9HYPO|nr:MYND finger [Fusarium albosuccineum]
MSQPSLSGLAPRACEACKKRDNLLRCSSCRAVYYCGQDHQAADRKAHKKKCNLIKRARIRLEEQEQELRNMPGDMFIPENVFENGVGHFWGIHETRPYMQARYELVDKLLQNFGTAGGRADVVQSALDHLLDMLRLCRGDNMGLRELVPFLFIRLDRDQAAYDFVKWYATTGDASDYDWGDMDLPFLDVKDAHVLEAPLPKWAGSGWIDLSHAVAVTLIKVRILLDLQAAQSTTRVLQGTLPPEIVQLIRDQLVGSIVQSNPKLLKGSTEKIGRVIRKVKDHIKELYASINRYNPYFWRLMLSNPVAAAATRPNAYSPKSKEEACLIIGYSLDSWLETPRALDLMKSLSIAA